MRNTRRVAPDVEPEHLEPNDSEPPRPTAFSTHPSHFRSPLEKPEPGYVPYGQPTGWAAIAENIRKYDEDKVKDSKEDIDTLMTFVSSPLLL